MEGWKVLLVDDEKEFVSTLAERLRLRGIQADDTGSGEEALRLIADATPQVVVSGPDDAGNERPGSSPASEIQVSTNRGDSSVWNREQQRRLLRV